MPQDPKVKQGQTLSQTAQNPGSPKNMAKILGVAGEGLWDFLGQAQEYLVPQSVEELALEGSPVGKAIGLIPPKYVRPMVEKLRGKVAQQFGNPEVREIIQSQISRNPGVAAHLGTIREMSPAEMAKDPMAAGYYEHILRGNPNIRPDTVEEWGGNIVANPRHFRNVDNFADTLRHEFNHTAQDVAGHTPKLQEWTEEIPYMARPEEIGSRISEARGRWLRDPVNKGRPFDYKEALEAELGNIEYSLQLKPEQYPAFNESLMYMNEQLKPKGLRIGVQEPLRITGLSRSLAPTRKFKVEKVVMDR